MDSSLPGFSVHRIFQTKILEQIVISYSRGSSQPRDQTHIYWISCTGREILYYGATWEPSCQCWKHKRHWFNYWVRKISWRKAWQPTSVFRPGHFHWQSSWWTMIHRVAKSQTWLKQFSTHLGSPLAGDIRLVKRKAFTFKNISKTFYTQVILQIM